jgi:hypothetical protein
MNRDNPKIISDETLFAKVFKYDSSVADNRFFRQRIIDFLRGSNDKSFSQFMFHTIWERNDGGKTLKYCHFNEYTQRVCIDPYFYEWMTRTIRKAEVELINSSNADGKQNTYPGIMLCS